MSERRGVPAGLVPRGAAYLVDVSIVFVGFATTQWFVLTPLREALGLGELWFHSGLNTELYTLLTVSLPVWAYFALTECSARRATLGKRLLGLQVVDAATGSRIGGGRSLLRTVVKLLPWELSHLANNFPEPVWYAADPGFRPGFAAVGILMGAYMLTVGVRRRHQGPHDMVASTVVVRRLPASGRQV